MLLLRNFISKVPLGSVINIKCNGEIIDSFKAKDFIINKKHIHSSLLSWCQIY